MSSEIKVDTISENTSANGVAIDSLGIKDGKINKEFVDLMEDDDPMREVVETIKIKMDDNLGAEA